VIPKQTISAALVAAARTSRGMIAIEHDGRSRSISYAELLAQALLIGGALLADGLMTDDRVALVVPEVSSFVNAFFAISAAGLLPVPLVPPAQAGDVPTFARQTRQLLASSRAAAVLTTAEVAGLLDLRDLTPAPRVLVIDTILRGPALETPASPALDQPALLQFTSGSTAAPKGVVLTHANLHANIAALSGPRGLNVGPSDVGVSWLPLYHDMGLIGGLLAAMYTQVNIVLMSPVLFLKRPTAWLEALSQYRGTISFAPNFAYELCLRRVKPSQIGTLDLSSWRVAGCGAEPVRADTLRAFGERFAQAGFRASSFIPSYGLAEHSLAVTFCHQGLKVDSLDPGRLVRESRAVPIADRRVSSVRLVSCGRPFPEHDVKIVDEEGRRLPDRYVGRIVVRGPSVMAGYFEDPVATADALHNGWLHTGDLGYLAGGELFVCGRTKDLIIRHGRKYHPPDLESAIADLRGVRPAGVVVFGINHPDEPDEVVAVLEARASMTTEDIIDHVRRRVRETAGLELDRVIIAPPGTIPHTTSGKVRRAETRARFQAGTLLTGGESIN
jgi:acyl-CoA synthetase (AMP-forming)/AMP-acid ligase II